MSDRSYIHKRLLLDIAELQNEPYPNIILHINDDLSQACLVLTPEEERPLHLTMIFPGYPLAPPVVTIQSAISHPNIFGSYICASILNTTEGYTPAYTLKSIAIQLLSFFSSDSLEQVSTRSKIPLGEYREASSQILGNYVCKRCDFDDRAKFERKRTRTLGDYLVSPKKQRRSRWDRDGDWRNQSTSSDEDLDMFAPIETGVTLMEVDGRISTRQSTSQSTEVHGNQTKDSQANRSILALPDEVALLIFAELSTKDLWSLTEVLPSVRDLLVSYDFIRVRELQCFCLKENFLNVKLGIGVHIANRGREGTFESEFDLLSSRAFQYHGIRKSIQGLYFEHWLPLPLSRRHWRTVRPEVDLALEELARCADLEQKSDFDVIAHFLNDIVVQFNREAEELSYGSKSTLSHASEKAVESYFALYHLLLCLAVEQPSMVRKANQSIGGFLNGGRSKGECPNLGLLLVAVLISDHGLTEELTVGIIKQAVLRNVVWMLDARGANKPELSYLEPSAISDYRLHHTFQASRTSYRLLMFLALFFRSARTPGKSLAAIRDGMFDAHGAPPRGMAESMAREIRRIKDIQAFPPFLKEMGIKTPPHKAEFCSFLKRMVTGSREAGYSAMPLGQKQAYALRRIAEPGVEMTEGLERPFEIPNMKRVTFFPSTKGRKGRGGNRQGRRPWD